MPKPNALLNLQPRRNHGDDTLSSSAKSPVQHGNITAEFDRHLLTVDQANAMTAEELHVNLQASLVGTLVCYAAAKILAVAAKMRMQNGEAVGGCLTFTGESGYVDKYLRREGQTLEAAVRAGYRLLDGLGISEKFDGSAARVAKKAAAEEKAKLIAAKNEDKAARLKLEEAAQKAKALKEKSNIEVLEAALEKQKTVTQAEIAAEAGKLQRPLLQQLEVAEKKIRDAARIAGHRADAEAAAFYFADYVVKNVTSDGAASVAVLKRIYALAAKYIRSRGETK